MKIPGRATFCVAVLHRVPAHVHHVHVIPLVMVRLHSVVVCRVLLVVCQHSMAGRTNSMAWSWSMTVRQRRQHQQHPTAALHSMTWGNNITGRNLMTEINAASEAEVQTDRKTGKTSALMPD